MPFFEEPEKRNTVKRNYSVKDYVTLGDIPVVLQFITKAVPVYQHWIPTDGKKGIPFKCLGAGNCPVCKRNEDVNYDENDPSFIASQEKWASSVIDLTPSKLCPECGAINTRNSAKCSNPECEHILIDVEVQPMNRVRYLTETWTFYKIRLPEFEKALTSTDSSILANHLPLAITKTRVNNQTNHTILPQLQLYDKYNPEEYLDKAFSVDQMSGINVSYDEMVILMNGGSFKEIIRSRKSETEDKSEELNSLFGG